MIGVLIGAEAGVGTGDSARTRNDPGLRGALSPLSPDGERHSHFPELAAGLVGTLLLFQGLGDVNLGAPPWCSPRGAVSAGRSDMLGGYTLVVRPGTEPGTELDLESGTEPGTEPATSFGWSVPCRAGW
jgi:hypothetical protein